MRIDPLLFAILAVLMLASCDMTKEIDYNKQYYHPLIVVHGNISWEYGVHAEVRRSLPPYYWAGSDTLTDVRVWLCHDDTKIVELQKLNAYEYEYRNVSVLNPAWGYCLQVEAKGYSTAVSTSQFKVDKLAIDSLYFVYNNKGVPRQLRFSFSDLYAVENYFSFSNIRYSDGVRDVPSFGIEIYLMSVSSDQSFARNYFIEERSIGFGTCDSIEATLFSLSHDAYIFGESYSDYEVSYGDHYYEDVYPVYSNIQGGAGVFYSYEKDVHFIKYQNINHEENN